MLDRIAEFIARHRMFEPGQRVGVAVSGGADSVFLLHALRELAPRWNLQLSVIHVEHGIRGAASIADAEFVAQLAATLGLPFHLQQADVPAIEGNLEEAARNIRQAFYAELIASGRWTAWPPATPDPIKPKPCSIESCAVPVSPDFRAFCR